MAALTKHSGYTGLTKRSCGGRVRCKSIYIGRGVNASIHHDLRPENRLKIPLRTYFGKYRVSRIADIFWKIRLMAKKHLRILPTTGDHPNRQAQRTGSRDTKEEHNATQHRVRAYQ